MQSVGLPTCTAGTDVPTTMGKLERFSICFNSSMTVFQAGEVLSGNVVVVLNRPMKADVLTLKIRGEAYVEWTDDQISGTVTYSTRDKYYDHKVPLWEKSAHEPKIPSGTNVFPFNFQLTPDSPASYEGEYGHLRYWLKSTIVKPWFDHDTKKAFTVICHLDLNTIPRAKEPVLLTCGDEVGGCTSCSSNPGKFDATLLLDHRGYVPGEQVHSLVEINNASAESLTGFVVLKMYTQFRSGSKTKSQDKVVTRTNSKVVGPNEVKVWDDYLSIPPVPPTNLGGCRIIGIEYYLKAKLAAQDFCKCGRSKMGDEIVIGTVPLNLPRYLPVGFAAPAPRPPSHEPSPYPSVDTGPGYPPYPSAPGPSQSSYNAASAPLRPCMQRQMSTVVPAPSYEECMFIRQTSIGDEEDTEYTRGEANFAPRYPYYNLRTEPDHDQEPPPGYESTTSPPDHPSMSRI